MRFLRPAAIFYKAQYKLQAKNKGAFIFGILTPLIYSAVFSYQIILNFSLKANPFINLPIWEYFTVFFALQMVVFLCFDQSLRELVRDILSGTFDYHLMRPVNLWYYKFTRAPSLTGLIQTWLYFLCCLFCAYQAHMSLGKTITILGFTYTATWIYLNIKAFLRGLVFYRRDILNITMLEESINYFAINKPPEVFPQIIIALGTAILPVFVIHNNLFDLVRARNLLWVIGWTIFWFIFSYALNKLVWTFGIKRYESG